jgi:hypothetical protein
MEVFILFKECQFSPTGASTVEHVFKNYDDAHNQWKSLGSTDNFYIERYPVIE